MEDLDNLDNPLLKELQSNRQDLHNMLNDLKDFRKNLDVILPKSLDYKNRHLFSDRMDIVTKAISCELAVRKQIDSSIKQELDITKSLNISDEKTVDTQRVKLLAKALEGMN